MTDEGDEFSERDFLMMLSRHRIDDTHMTPEHRAELRERYRKEWENARWWQAQPAWPPWPFQRAKPPHPDI